MSDKIKIELTVEEARRFTAHYRDACVSNPENLMKDRVENALAAHEREEKRKALGLPWCSDTDVGINDPQVVVHTVYLGGLREHVEAPTAEVASLMAAAPELAEDAVTSRELLKEWLAVTRCAGMPITSANTRIRISNIDALLKKAGWDE